MVEVLGVVRRCGAVVLGRSVRGTGVMRSGLKLRRPGRCANPAPETPEHRRRVCVFSVAGGIGSGEACRGEASIAG